MVFLAFSLLHRAEFLLSQSLVPVFFGRGSLNLLPVNHQCPVFTILNFVFFFASLGSYIPIVVCLGYLIMEASTPTNTPTPTLLRTTCELLP